MWEYMNIEKMTGLEIMQEIVREELPHSTMTKSIPVKVMKVEKGKVVFNAIANNKQLSTQCGVHGGFASTVLDSVTGCAVHTLLGAGVAYGSIDLKKMIRPVPKEEYFITEGNVNHNLWKDFMDFIDLAPRMIFLNYSIYKLDN